MLPFAVTQPNCRSSRKSRWFQCFCHTAFSIALFGCSRSESSEQATKFSTAADIIYWSVGGDNRGDDEPTTESYILWLPRKKSTGDVPSKPQMEESRRMSTECNRATSIMLGPKEAGWILILIDGKIHISPNPTAKPEPVAGSAPASFARFLGFRNLGASLNVLASSTNDGRVQVWSVRMSIKSKTIEAANLIASGNKIEKDDPAFDTPQAFFANFTTPRCQDGGKECLSLSDDKKNRFVDIRPSQKQPPRESIPLGDAKSMKVRDAAWLPGDSSAMYLLVSCPKKSTQ